MKRLLALVLFLLASTGGAFAQATATVVLTCGTLPLAYIQGSSRPITVDINGNECVNASVSASITGFSPANTGTPISVTTGGVTGNLPSGAVVTAFNVGATNTAFCKLGASATVNDIAIPPASWFAFTVGGATQMTCITSTSTTTVNLVGGTGLPTGAGGGGGGGSGGAVTNAGTFAVQLTGGSNNINNIAGTVSLPTGAASATNQATEIASLASIVANTGAAIPAGTNNIGSVNGFTTNNSATQPHICGSSVFKHITSGTDTQVVAASGSTTIYVCDYDISFGGAQTLFLEKSTSGTCGSPTQIAQAWYGVANAGKIAANAFYRGLNTGGSAQLCANTTGVFSGSGADLTVFYDQY